MPRGSERVKISKYDGSAPRDGVGTGVDRRLHSRCRSFTVRRSSSPRRDRCTRRPAFPPACSGGIRPTRRSVPAVSHEVATGSRPVANAPTRRMTASRLGSEDQETAWGAVFPTNPEDVGPSLDLLVHALQRIGAVQRQTQALTEGHVGEDVVLGARRRHRLSDRRPSGSNRWRLDGRPDKARSMSSATSRNRSRRLSATSRQRAWAWSRSVPAETVFTMVLTIALEARLRHDRAGSASPTRPACWS